eukprot:4551292-Amphidinium_carterae.1
MMTLYRPDDRAFDQADDWANCRAMHSTRWFHWCFSSSELERTDVATPYFSRLNHPIEVRCESLDVVRA